MKQDSEQPEWTGGMSQGEYDINELRRRHPKGFANAEELVAAVSVTYSVAKPLAAAIALEFIRGMLARDDASISDARHSAEVAWLEAEAAGTTEVDAEAVAMSRPRH